jgi:hypothetical protein
MFSQAYARDPQKVPHPDPDTDPITRSDQSSSAPPAIVRPD